MQIDFPNVFQSDTQCDFKKKKNTIKAKNLSGGFENRNLKLKVFNEVGIVFHVFIYVW